MNRKNIWNIKKKYKKKLVPRYRHDVDDCQLFYEMDNDKKPIIKHKVSRNVLGKVISYKDARDGLNSCNYRHKSYFRKQQIRSDKRLQLLTTLASTAAEPTPASESDEDNITIMDIMIQAVAGEPEAKETGLNSNTNDSNDNSNVMNLLIDQARVRQQQLDRIVEEKDSIVTTVTVDSIIATIKTDPTNLDKIIRQELSKMKHEMDEAKLKQELNSLQGTTCKNLALKYFMYGIRLKVILLDETEFNRMIEAQLKHLKYFDEEILKYTSKRHGLYVCNIIYCNCCCETDWPSPFGPRNMKNCIVFIDSMRKNLKLWDTARSTLSSHVIGRWSNTHNYNFEQYTNRNKNNVH